MFYEFIIYCTCCWKNKYRVKADIKYLIIHFFNILNWIKAQP